MAVLGTKWTLGYHAIAVAEHESRINTKTIRIKFSAKSRGQGIPDMFPVYTDSFE